MLLNISTLRSYSIQATDGEIGECYDILFDDRFWTSRFLVIDTHPWMPLSHKVLISPVSILEVDSQTEQIKIALTKEQVKSAPSTDAHQPVSREFERLYFNYFGFGHYWVGPGAWGDHAYPSDLANIHQDSAKEIEQKHQNEESDKHLRSVREVKDYMITGPDKSKGHVHDFIIDTATWKLEFLVIDTRDWLPGGRKVFMIPDQFEEISWADKALKTEMAVSAVKELPEYETACLSDQKYVKTVRKVLRAESAADGQL